VRFDMCGRARSAAAKLQGRRSRGAVDLPGRVLAAESEAQPSERGESGATSEAPTASGLATSAATPPTRRSTMYSACCGGEGGGARRRETPPPQAADVLIRRRRGGGGCPCRGTRLKLTAAAYSRRRRRRAAHTAVRPEAGHCLATLPEGVGAGCGVPVLGHRQPQPDRAGRVLAATGEPTASRYGAWDCEWVCLPRRRRVRVSERVRMVQAHRHRSIR